MSKKRKKYLVVIFATIGALLTSFFTMSSGKEETFVEQQRPIQYQKQVVEMKEVVFFDSIRSREIPYAVFSSSTKQAQEDSVRLILFSHGYGSNYTKNYLNYTYLTKFLARKGFLVLSIQHELVGDSLLPQGENVYEARYPIWKRGSENILSTLNHFQKENPGIRFQSIDLIGHSNGGDMSILTAKNHSKLIRSVITLDHLRMPIPLVAKPVFSSLRSTDKKADLGVLPNRLDAEKLDIKIIQLRNITHNEMNDKASKKQKNQINTVVLRLLARFN